MSIDDVLDVAPESLFGGPHSVGLVETKSWTFDEPALELDCGQTLAPVTQAYETYGTLSPQRDNAILIEHALTGDAHVAGYHSPEDRKPGWWDNMVGPGKPYDTDRYFVVCSNIIGGCKGSTGPSSINPATGRPYALDFPIVTIGDMVRAQQRLMEHLGISRWLAVAGGSMGGMQALDWAMRYPDKVASILPIAATSRMSAQGIAFDEVARQAIMADPRWMGGDYYGKDNPEAGLAIARMIGHITYLSQEQMHSKFGRKLQNSDAFGYGFKAEFEVESYLRYQGDAFVKRFDANSYLYITKSVDYFDLTAGYRSLVEALEHVQAEFLVMAFPSDWLFPPEQSKELVRALQANGVRTTFLEIPSTYGHDAFLLPNEHMENAIRGFLANVQRRVRNGQGGAE